MYKGIKRFFDIVASLVALILLGPLLLVIIIVLSVTGEGEVFYRQQRIGYLNNPFRIWKFATMVKNSSNMGTGDITLRKDPRVTKIGSILRITKLNELPQLLNILMGEMSFVGPRPLTEKGFNLYSDTHKRHIYSVTPGLTGIGSIIFRDEELIISNSHLSPHDCFEQVIMPYKGELEMWYQQNQSFSTDFMLLILTVWYIFNPHSNLVFKVFRDLPKKQLQVA